MYKMADRIAQTVAALTLEPRTESIFHDDSFGYRPGRSPLTAVAKCRQRCWKRAWVIDLDVAKFFDSVNHELMVKAVQANITPEQKWVVLYAGSFRCRIAPGHGVDEVVGAAVSASGGAGDVGFAVASVEADGGVAEHGGDGGAVAGAGLMGVFAQGDVADPVRAIA